MKKTLKLSALLLCVLSVGAVLFSCGQKTFGNDLRYRYDYDLTDYLKKGKYTGLEVYVGNTDVTDGEIDDSVRRNSVLGCEWTDIYDRVCAEGDIVGVSYQGYRRGASGEFDEPVEALSKGFVRGEPADTPEALSESSATTLPIVLGANELFPGFEDQIIGAFSVGERRTLTFTLPEPCWEFPALAGEEIRMDVLLTYIQEIEYPEDGDAYAQQSGFGSMEDYRLNLGSKLIKTRSEQVETYVHTRVWAQINDNFTVKKYPEKELSETVNALRDVYTHEAEQRSMTLEEYISDFLGLTEQEFDARVGEEAKKAVKDEMIVYYIAREEQIGVSQMDFEDGVEEMMAQGEFSDIDQYIRYIAYYNGYAKEGETLTQEILDRAENFLKEQVLFTMVDDFVDENTQRTAER